MMQKEIGENSVNSSNPTSDDYNGGVPSFMHVYE